MYEGKGFAIICRDCGKRTHTTIAYETRYVHDGGKKLCNEHIAEMVFRCKCGNTWRMKIFDIGEEYSLP